jgi:hypothetical protein
MKAFDQRKPTRTTYIERSGNRGFEWILPLDSCEVSGSPKDEGALEEEANPMPLTTGKSCGGA